MTTNVRDFSGDIGNGYVKVKSSTQAVSFPAVISVEDLTASGFEAGGLSSNNDFLIEYDGKRWAIGETVLTHGLTPVSITDRSRIEQKFYRVLFAAALSEGVQQSATVRAILSLPPAMYWDKERQKEALAGEYEVRVSGRTRRYEVPIEMLRVIPEGFGIAAALCLDRSGNLQDSELFGSSVGIIDVGTYSCDFLQLLNMKPVRAGTDSFTHALSDLHRKARTFAASQNRQLDVHEADIALRERSFLKAGRRVSISQEVNEWSEELAEAIAGRVRSLWSGGDAVEHILIAGGGGPYIASFLEREFPHARLVDAAQTGVQPWEANCEGAYRYALLRNRVG